MSGENPCYNCVYTCKAAEGFYGNQSECTRNNPGKSCYVEETSGCYKAGDCDELNNYYNDSGSCEAANTGYFCKEDELSKCYVKGDARQCPQDEYTKGGCAEKPGNKLDEIASGNYAGEEACYRCSYSCLTDQGYYPNSGVCEDANKGYICETDPESGCFVKTDAAPCPENEYTSGKCPSKPGNTTQYVPTENMSGTNQCYTCEYQCDAEERYYPSDELCTTNNKGRTCSLDGLSQCYTPTGCDEKQGYYEDLPLCMQNNTGYACKSEDGCYVKDIALECPENEYVTCPEKEGNIATPTPTDNYAGEYRCNTCSYACNNDTGHYTEETECTAAHQGWLCAMDVPSGCYKTSTCDEANHFYNKQESCEEYYNGYSCTLSAGCYVKGGVKPCPSEPEQEYTECPVITGKKLVSSDPTGNMSGEQQCYTCQYECDVAPAIIRTNPAATPHIRRKYALWKATAATIQRPVTPNRTFMIRRATAKRHFRDITANLTTNVTFREKSATALSGNTFPVKKKPATRLKQNRPKTSPAGSNAIPALIAAIPKICIMKTTTPV